MCNDINTSGCNGCTFGKRVPVFVFAHHGRCIAYIGVSVAAEVDGLIGGVVNFEVLVIAASFGILREEQPALCGSGQASSDEQGREQQVE